MGNRPIAGAADPQIERLVTRQGIRTPIRSASVARFLTTEDLGLLQEKWQDDWPARISLRGNQWMITCAMLREVSWQDLVKQFGPAKAKLFKDLGEAYN